MGNCVSGSSGMRSSQGLGGDGYESDVDTRNKQQGSSRTSFPDESLSHLKPLAKKVYDDSVLWHGTAREHVSSLRRNGFQKELKGSGATSGGAENFLMSFSSGGISASSEHHYLSSSRDTAKHFAMHTDSYQPALVRTIGVRNNFPLEQDLYTDDPAALRTLSSIPAAHVLGAKNSDPGADAKVFRDEMRMAGHDVSTEQAGHLLREVQSDSDSDSFPDVEDFIMQRLRG